MNLKNNFDSSDINVDSPPAPQNKITSLKGSHRFAKINLTSFIIFFLLLKILLSIVLLILGPQPPHSMVMGNLSQAASNYSVLFKKYSQLLEEKAIIKELNFTGLECTKRHSLLKDKVWSCCPKDWKPFSSHCYFISTDSASWNESEEKCSSMGAHLMVIRSQEEQDFITKILRRDASYFIGLSDPGHRQWRWVDQTPYNKSATFWHPGEPNKDHEQCAAIYVWHNNWGWNDISCSTKQKSVCQMMKIYL
ncbi:C-type lectin domain family 4 member A-like isoform X1 [Microtus pennsylvanicus]|uniref:C-type lectin domain family 4 member A-like isoform X1 n=1 Tax=Microtus pennsylvanicus TaxID=10058 RepID=UPI003F6BA5FA